VLALAALEAPPRRWNALVVEALALAVEARAVRNVGEDLTHYQRLLLYYL
jgi:hypothetical protein